MRKVLIGTAAIAIAAMTGAYSLPADAQGRGNGNDKDKGAEQAQQRGNGGGKPDKGKPDKSRQGQGAPSAAMAIGPAKAQPQGRSKDKSKGRESAPVAAIVQSGAKGNNPAKRGARQSQKDRYRDGESPFFARYDRGGDGGLIAGCPPGLAKKDNGCMPPGLAKKRNYYGADWFGLSGLGDGVRYYEGYMVRSGASGIAAYIPLLGGALGVGEQWPGQFGVRNVPDYYRSYYNLGDSYRYYDHTLYRLDPKTQAITSIAALITGDDITVGSQMPRGYDVYNVPPGYRDRYEDGPDAYYRYSDGYIYQVDPTTKLVAAAIELLV